MGVFSQNDRMFKTSDFPYTYQQRSLRREHGPDASEHGTDGQQRGPHLGGKYFRAQHVNGGKGDGYGEFAGYEQRQFCQNQICSGNPNEIG